MITNLGTGLSLRVNDETNDADASPFVVDNAGNVGIGIASPTSKVHAIASGAKIASDTGYLLRNTSTSSTDSIEKIGLRIESSGTWNGLTSTNTGLSVSVGGGTSNYAATFSGGNVGIGTVDPASSLHIVKSISLPNAIDDDPNNFFNQNHFKMEGSTNALYLGVDNVGNSRTSWLQSGHRYSNNISAVSDSEFAIQPLGGRVGIGTFAPTEKLEVSGGNILTSGRVAIGGATSALSACISNNGADRLFHDTNCDGVKDLVDNFIDLYPGASLSDADNDTKIQVEEAADEDIIRFDTAGTERMVINASGNVGLGVSPTQHLEIAGSHDGWNKGTIKLSNTSAGTSAAAGILFDTDQAGTDQAAIYYGSTTNSTAYAANRLVIDGENNGIVLVASGASGNVLFYTGGATERMRIANNGNVGIGTATTTNRLNVSIGAGVNSIIGRFGNDTRTDSITMAMDASGHSNIMMKAYGGGTERVIINSSGDSYFNGGDLGVGTISPDARLHVTSGGTTPTGGYVAGTQLVVQNSAAVGDTSRIAIISGNTGYSTIEFGDTDDSDIGRLQYNHSLNALAMSTNAATTWTNPGIIITSTQNVGLGVADPDAKLEINGQIKITGGTPGAGKVLTSDADGLATWASVSGAACPAGFNDIVVATKGRLGCMQNGISVGLTTWIAAKEACFDTYGGRLPTASELSIALTNFALSQETEYTWTDAVYYNPTSGDNESNIYMYNGADNFSSSDITTSNAKYRCFIPTPL
jgi:hypothetical protein